MIPRFRFRDMRNTVAGTLVQEIFSKDCTTGASSWSTNWTGNYSYKVGSYETMNDVIIPGFKRKSSEGGIFINPMTKSTYEVDGGYGGGQDLVGSSTTGCPTTFPYEPQSRRSSNTVTFGRVLSPISLELTLAPNGAIVVPSSLIDGSILADLITEASTAVHNCRGRGNSGSNQYETIAELDKSLGMLGQSLKNLNSFLGKNSRVVSRAKAAASSFLLYRYGILPLMSAVEDACEVVNRAQGRVRQTCRGAAATNKTVTSNFSADLFGIHRQSYTVTKVETLSVRAMNLDEYVATFGTNAGLSFKNLATLPWELLPYSFVVDWFTNIGDFVGSLVPVPGLTALGSCTVIKRELEIKVASTSSTPISAYWNIIHSPLPSHGCSARWTTTNRSPGIASPGLTIRSNFKLNNMTRVADLVSLLTQRLK